MWVLLLCLMPALGVRRDRQGTAWLLQHPSSHGMLSPAGFKEVGRGALNAVTKEGGKRSRAMGCQ